MISFRLEGRPPPEPRPVADGVIARGRHAYEVDPARMQVVRQQDLAAWDAERIAAGRRDHLEWMHRHWASRTLAASELDEST